MFVFNIKNVRKSKKISLNKLHKLTGISRAYLFDLENNRKFNPTIRILENIAEKLNVNVKDLFYCIDEIDTLKEEMHRRINEFGIKSKEALEVSQIIDLLLNLKKEKD